MDRSFIGNGKFLRFTGYNSPTFLGAGLETFHIFGDFVLGPKVGCYYGEASKPTTEGDIFHPEDPIVLSYYVTE